jgi:hypothetical protein
MAQPSDKSLDPKLWEQSSLLVGTGSFQRPQPAPTRCPPAHASSPRHRRVSPTTQRRHRRSRHPASRLLHREQPSPSAVTTGSNRCSPHSSCPPREPGGGEAGAPQTPPYGSLTLSSCTLHAWGHRRPSSALDRQRRNEAAQTDGPSSPRALPISEAEWPGPIRARRR